MKTKFSALGMAFIMLLSCCTTAYASNLTAREEFIQSEIHEMEELVYANVYMQLEAQNALSHFEIYKEILRPDIEAAVRAKYGETATNVFEPRVTVRYYCPDGAVLTYIEPNTGCEVAVTYFDDDDASTYVLSGDSFSCWVIIQIIFNHLIDRVQEVAPFSYVLDLMTIATAMNISQINKAGGYARVINVRDPLDNTRSSVVAAWSDHEWVEIPSGIDDYNVTRFPAKDA